MPSQDAASRLPRAVSSERSLSEGKTRPGQVAVSATGSAGLPHALDAYKQRLVQHRAGFSNPMGAVINLSEEDEEEQAARPGKRAR